MSEITKNTVLVDALGMGDTAKMAAVLSNYGMHCLGCVFATRETVEEAALSHGVDPDAMLAELKKCM